MTAEVSSARGGVGVADNDGLAVRDGGGEIVDCDLPKLRWGDIWFGCAAERPYGDGAAVGEDGKGAGGAWRHFSGVIGLAEPQGDGGAVGRDRGACEGGRRVRDRFVAIDGNAEHLVAPGLLRPGAVVVPVEKVLDVPPRKAGRILSTGGGGVDPHIRAGAGLDHHHVVGVRREGEAGVRELQVPGREARRRRQGRAGRGWKLENRAILLADLDVEGVALGVLGDDGHAGEHVAGRVVPRVEELRMVVAAGVGFVIAPLRCVGHENARGLRLRLGRPEEQQAQDEDGGGRAAWTGGPTGAVSIPRPGRARRSGCVGLGRTGWGRRMAAPGQVRRSTQAERWSLGNSRRSARLGSARLGSARLGSARLGSARLRIAESKRSLDVKSFFESFIIILPRCRSDRVTAHRRTHHEKHGDGIGMRFQDRIAQTTGSDQSDFPSTCRL